MGLRDRFICDWAFCLSVLNYVQKAQRRFPFFFFLKRRFKMVSLLMKNSKVNNYGGPINFKGFHFFSFRESILLGCYPVCLSSYVP